MSYYSETVKRIKDQVNKNKYPPEFIKRIKPCFDFRNCYAYALNLNVNDIKKRIYFPGCISQKDENPYIFDSNSLVSRLKRDLEFLGFSYRENDEQLKEGEYRIAIYAFPSFHDMPIGFHISRQDMDGFWSEKPNWKDKPRMLKYSGVREPDIGKKTCFKTVLIIKKS